MLGNRVSPRAPGVFVLDVYGDRPGRYTLSLQRTDQTEPPEALPPVDFADTNSDRTIIGPNRESYRSVPWALEPGVDYQVQLNGQCADGSAPADATSSVPFRTTDASLPLPTEAGAVIIDGDVARLEAPDALRAIDAVALVEWRLNGATVRLQPGLESSPSLSAQCGAVGVGWGQVDVEVGAIVHVPEADSLTAASATTRLDCGDPPTAVLPSGCQVGARGAASSFLLAALIGLLGARRRTR